MVFDLVFMLLLGTAIGLFLPRVWKYVAYKLPIWARAIRRDVELLKGGRLREG